MAQQPQMPSAQQLGWDPSQGFGGGALNRQITPPELLAAQQRYAMGQGGNATQFALQAALAQQQRGMLGAQAGGQGYSPFAGMLAARQGMMQQAPSMWDQMLQQRQQEFGNATQGYLQNLFGQQKLNDQLAMQREQALANILGTRATGQLQSAKQQQDMSMANFGAFANAAGMGLAAANRGGVPADAQMAGNSNALADYYGTPNVPQGYYQ